MNTSNKNNRVAVTGLGLITGLGLNLESTWQGLISGKSPVKRFTLFDPSGLTTPFGIELPEEVEELFKKCIKTRNRSQMTRATMLSLVTAEMALEDAKIRLEGTDTDRIAVVIGATGTGYAPAVSTTDPNRILKNMASSHAAWISLKLKIHGPAYVVSTACSSGTFALGAAMMLILSGQCDIAITGASDSVMSYQDVEGFCSLMALTDDIEHMETSSRPFDRRRNGFVMGEGSGMMIVESREHAQKRGARIYADVSLPGLFSEAYNIISPQPGGIGMAQAMKRALDSACLVPEQIDYINAHGTSTQLNDLYETQAIKEVFGAHAYAIPVSSTKSMTGHCLSGAAGVESVIACKALVENCIPPTMHLTDPDPELDLDYVPGAPRLRELNHVMSNSFAFGGHNGVCIFSRHTDA